MKLLKIIFTIIVGVNPAFVCGLPQPKVDGLGRTSWAERLVGGPMKIVFIGKGSYADHHQTYELTKRIDIDARVVPVINREAQAVGWPIGITGHYYPHLIKTAEDVFNDVRKALRPYWESVVLDQGPAWTLYPEDIRKLILLKVASGRTLVINRLDGGFKKDLHAAGLRLKEVRTHFRRFRFLGKEPEGPEFYRCGKGLVVVYSVGIEGSKYRADYTFNAARTGWFLWRATRPQTKLVIETTAVKNGLLEIRTVPTVALSNFFLQVKVRWRDSYELVASYEKKVRVRRLDVKRLPADIETLENAIQCLLNERFRIVLE